MNTKHTPGPWKARTFNFPTGTDTRIEPEGGIYTIATIFTPSSAPEAMAEIDKANVKLISAAPDLLQALQTVLNWAKNGNQEDLIVFQQAQQAIKKATEQ